MARMGLAVADDANNCHAVEALECVRHIPFSLELLLAEVAPCLKIIWVAVVLDESDRRGFTLQHVLADNG